MSGPSRDRRAPWREDPVEGFETFEERLGSALEGARWHGALDPARLGRQDRFRRRTILAVAAGLLAVAGVLGWVASRPAPERGAARFTLISIAGDVRVEGGTSVASAGEQLAAGARLLLGRDGKALLEVGDIGRLELFENSRLRIDPPLGGSSDGAYRVQLEIGTAEANVAAAPRVFHIGTPAGLTVDLGCKYRTQVREDGFTTLDVLTGAVAFEALGRKLHVPKGARLSAARGAKPSTPHWANASTLFLDALARLDASERADPSDLELLLGEAEERDSLTLWNLLDHPDPQVRRALYEWLAALQTPPASVTLDAILRGDEPAREKWRNEVLRHFW